MVEGRRLLFFDDLDDKHRRMWLEYWANHAHAAWRQHPKCGEVAKASGEQPIYVIGLDEGKIKLAGVFGVRPFFFGLCALEAVCLRGPIFEDVSFANWCLPQIQNYFQKRKVGSVRIGPYWRFPEAEELEKNLFGMGYQRFEKEHVLGRRETGIVDIQSREEELLKSFKQSTRYEIKHARKLGIEIRQATSLVETTEFFDHLAKRDKERGITLTPAAESRAVSKLFNAEAGAGAVINAYQGSVFLGGLMVARGGKAAFTVKFVVSEDCKRLLPTLRIAPAIFFSGMLWAKSQGCESVDLEGYSATDSNQADKVFVNRYKAGFRPTECETLGQYFTICNLAIYRIQRLVGFAGRLTRLPYRLAHRINFELKKRKIERSVRQNDEAAK